MSSLTSSKTSHSWQYDKKAERQKWVYLFKGIPFPKKVEENGALELEHFVPNRGKLIWKYEKLVLISKLSGFLLST